MAWNRKFLKLRPEDGASGSGGGAADAGVGAGASGGSTPAGGAGAPSGGDGGAESGGAAAGAGAGGAGDAGAAAGAAGASASGDAGKGGEAYWPADWRDTVSKGDAKILQRMSRYASPQAMAEALIAAQNRISAGELKPVLGKNPSADELKAWRADHGIPETADKYELKDIKIEGMDPKLLGTVMEAAHASNQTPEQLQATMKAWTKISQDVAATRAESDIAVQKTSEDTLRAEWGNEYRRNINLIHGMLDGAATPQLKDALLSGRLADGTPIGSSPDALKLLVNLALIQNPTGIVVPGSEANQMQGIEDEIGRIEKVMNTNRSAYNKDEKMQARYRELLGAREAMKPRKAA